MNLQTPGNGLRQGSHFENKKQKLCERYESFNYLFLLRRDSSIIFSFITWRFSRESVFLTHEQHVFHPKLICLMIVHYLHKKMKVEVLNRVMMKVKGAPRLLD